jgi:enolase
VAAVNGKIADAIVGMDARTRSIDETMIELDGTANKAKLGANAILGVSLAVAKAAARSLQPAALPLCRRAVARVLPVPMMNIINGGEHADNPIDFQEFMIMPVGAERPSRTPCAWAPRSSTRSRRSCRPAGTTPMSATRAALRPTSSRAEDALDFIMKSIEKAGYKAGEDMYLALDCARPNSTRTASTTMKARASRSSEHGAYLAKLVADYPIISIEDGMAEDDWDGWKALTELRRQGASWWATTCSSPTRSGCRRHQDGRGQLDPGQGQPDRHADRNAGRRRYGAQGALHGVMSHRSGETEDATIADLAVATNCGQIKTGSLARSDRLAKYNQLIRIEEMLTCC